MSYSVKSSSAISAEYCPEFPLPSKLKNPAKTDRRPRTPTLSASFVRGLVFVSVMSGTASLVPAQNATPAAGVASSKAVDNYLHLPLAFERRGTGANEIWTARGQGYSIGIYQREMTIRTVSKKTGQANETVLEFEGANSPQGLPGAELPGKVNYIYGNDPKKWQTGLSTYDSVTYRGLYPGVDLVYHGKQQQLEFDLVVAAGADPRAIRMKVGGGQKLSIDDKGSLVIGESDLRIALPRIYQEINGVRQVVAGRYTLQGQGEAGFALDAWDRSRPLVIDPTLQPGITLSALLGGSTGGTFGEKVALDSSGNIYIAGYTSATDLPAVNAAQGNTSGTPDGFITEVNAAGNSIIYSTYIGGSGTDELLGIAVDSNGDAWTTGYSASFDFPTMNATQSTLGGASDAIVVELNPSGALAFSTYLGGSAADQGWGIAVDGSNSAYVTGYTNAGGSFPTTAGVIQSSKQGSADIFVTKYSSEGSVVYSTLLGGAGQDEGLGIAVDSNGDAYLTGLTSSSAFVPANPPGGAQASIGGGADAFVAELNPAASALLYFTYLGGPGTDQGTSIAVNPVSGLAYFAGFTTSAGIATASAAQSSYAGGYDGFVASLNPGGTAFNYVTYLGGNRSDMIEGLALDGSGNVYVTGSTDSANLPTNFPLQATLSGNTTSMLQTTNSGSSWSGADSNIPGAVFDVSPDPVNSGTIVVATEQGIYLTTNNGSSWAQEVGGVFGALYLARSPVNPSIIYSVQGNGLTRISTNNGTSWMVAGTGPSASGIVADGVSAGTAYAFGNGSGVYVTTNSGSTWTASNTGLPSTSIAAMAAGTDGAVYAVIQNFGVYKSLTQGASWTSVNNGLSGPFFSSPHSITAGPGNPSVLALAMSGQVYFSSDGANTWGVAGLPDTAAEVSTFGTDASGNLYLYAGAVDGSMYEISTVTDNWASAGAFLTTSGFATLAVDPLNNAHVFAVPQAPSSSFVAKVNNAGSVFSYLTYLGGIGPSTGWGIAINGGGQTYVTGNTGGQGFPITEPFVLPMSGQTDAFITLIADNAGSCTYTVEPGAETLLGNAQQVSIGVVAPYSCPWTVSGNPVWAFVAPTSSSGTSVVSVQVTANTSGSTRSGTINIGGQTVTITQADSSCSFGLDQFPYYVAASGGTFTANLTTAAGCPWAIQDNDPGAIQINSATSGSGDGTISISVGPNNTLNQRNFSLPVGNNVISIVQYGTCVYTLKSSSVNVPSGGGSGSVTFTTNNPSCSFFPPVQSNAYWISISEPGGAINYTAAANAGVTPRSGQLNINGSTLTINQAAQPIVNSIVNGADGSAPPLAPGSLATIYGNYLADSTVNASTSPLPFALGGASLTVDGYPAAIFFASPGQINFQIPYEVTIGTATLVITVDGSISNTFTFSVVAAAPGIQFISNTNPTSTLNTASNPVAPGGTAFAYFTGGGAVTPAVADGTVPTSGTFFHSLFTATIAGAPAGPFEVFLAPGSAVTGEAVIEVPILPPGAYPLVISSGGRSSLPATIYISGAVPSVSAVTPNSTPAGSGPIPVTISGANLAGGGNVVFTPPGGTATSISPNLAYAAQVYATLPAALLTTAGTAQIAMMNGSGVLSNSVPFYVTPFTITGATPNSTPAGSSNTLVTVSGENLSTATNLSFTAPGGVSTSIPLSLIQAAEAQATVPSSYLTTAGTAQVALSNAAGALSNSVPFYVTPFTITTVMPNSVTVGSGATLVTVNGSNLSTTASLAFTAPNGQVTAITPSLIASAQVQATLPPALLSSAGTAQIQLANGAAALSNPLPFVVSGSAAQTISFDVIPNQIFGISPFVIAAQASSGLPVTFASTTPAVCMNADDLVMLLSTGTCSITASQPGSAIYAAATPVTQSFTVSRANVSGSFEAAAGSPFAVESYPYAVVKGDFNGDGIPDLATANSSGDVTVLLGNGSGGFALAAGSPIATGEGPVSVALAVGDFNGDGLQDIAVANQETNNITMFLGNGSGGFAQATGSPLTVGTSPFSVAVGDFNADGIEDLAVANLGSGSVTVLLGNGSGGFTQATGSPFMAGLGPHSVVVGDFNGDGIPDLAVANSESNNVTILLGNGSAGFTAAAGSPFLAGSFPISVVVGDFNADGIQDLATANLGSHNVTVLLGNGSGGFTPAAGSPFPVGTNPWSVVVGDFNGDGIQDLTVADDGNNNIMVLLGNGSGGFAAAAGSPFAVGSNPLSVAVGDFNRDGIEDLAVANGASNNVTVLLGFAVGSTSQTITFGPLSNVTFGIAPFTIGATASSGLAVSFASTASGVCLVSGNTVLVTGAGTCSIIASQNGNATYAAAATVMQSFTVNPPPVPSISSVAPNAALAGSGSTPVTITGANFGSGAAVQWTAPGGQITVISPSLIQAAQIAATIPAALLSSAGTAQIAITNGLGTLSNPVPFYVTPFTIYGATPNSAPAGSSNTLVTISGQNLSTATNLSFTAPGGASTSIPLSLIQAAQAQATVPSAYLTTAGTAQVALSNGAGALSNPVPFYVTPFTITSIMPKVVATGSGATQIAVNGSNLDTATTLSFTPPGGGTSTIPLSLIAEAQVQATLPAAFLTSAGTAQVQLANVAGALSNPLTFTIGVQAVPVGVQPASTTAYMVNEDGSLVSLTGGASTSLAPGIGCGACFDFARDSQGDLIVAAANQLTMYSITGTPLSPVAAPAGSSFVSVAIDSYGDYIVADNRKHQIFRISPLGTQVVATYPVNDPDLLEDAYVRVDSNGNYILAEDNSTEGNPALYLFRITPGGQVTPIPINPTGEGLAPGSTGGLTFDASGNYIDVDWINDVIFTITPAGASTPLFTDPNGYLGDPEGISRDPVSGYFFLVDDVNAALYMFAPDGSNFAQIASGGLLTSPASVIVVDDVATTFTTSPEGILVSVDGAAQLSPFTMSLPPGSHTMAVAATVAGTPGTQLAFTGWSDLGALSHQISVGSTALTYTATFQTQYQLSIALSLANAGSTAPPSGTYYNAGQVVSIQATPGSGYAFSSWTGPVANQTAATTVTMNGPQSLTANLVLVAPTLFESVPSGLKISVDGGANQVTPFTAQLAPGPHTISLAPTQPGPSGSQYVFTGWSDAGATSHSIVITATAATYTATFKTQYQLTTIASPAAAGTVSPVSGGFYDPGAVVNLLASPGTGYAFGSWTGAAANSGNASTTVTMGSAAQTVTANFSSTTGITLQTNPPGLLVSVDGNPSQVAPFTANLSSGNHSIAVASPQAGGPGTRYVYNNWSDGLAASHPIMVGTGPSTYTASFTTQYLVTGQALTGGSVTLNPSSADGYYTSGASVTATAVPNAGYSFASFGGSLTGPTNPQNLTVTQPASITGNFIPPNPAISLAILNKTTSAGVTTLTLALTNTGGSDASAVTLSALVASIVTGTGSVSLISPSLPAALGTITQGNTYDETVQVAITGTVTKFKLATSGSMRNTQGTLLTISGSNLIIP